MDYKNLYTFVLTLVLIGIIIGVGLLVLGKFGDATRDTNTVNNETSDNIATGFAGTPSNMTITLTNTPVRDITRITNSSNYVAILNTDYNVSSLATGSIILWNYTENGMFTSGGGGSIYVNITYRYYADSKATTELDNVIDAVAEIPSTWLPLIVTIVVLAIILTLVISSFVGIRRR